jgi:hypothetical protein
MEPTTRTHIENLFSQDRELQNSAFLHILEATARPVDWAYEAWDQLLEGLIDKDNHVRAIAAQILCNLALSDPEERMLRDFPRLLAVTKDERFVTARHTLQAIWKVGLAGEKQREAVLKGLAFRFHECASEKNCTLIRYDIIQGLRNLYDETEDGQIHRRAQELIGTEPDLKYRKKYAGVWKDV